MYTTDKGNCLVAEPIRVGRPRPFMPAVHDEIVLPVVYHASIERHLATIERHLATIWLGTKWAPVRRRPKRVAKKLAQRKGVCTFADFNALMEWLR